MQSTPVLFRVVSTRITSYRRLWRCCGVGVSQTIICGYTASSLRETVTRERTVPVGNPQIVGMRVGLLIGVKVVTGFVQASLVLTVTVTIATTIATTAGKVPSVVQHKFPEGIGTGGCVQTPGNLTDAGNVVETKMGENQGRDVFRKGFQ